MHKKTIVIAITAALLLAGCSTINGVFVSLQSGKNYIADSGLVFNGFQKAYESLCVNSAPQPFCAAVAPKMKAASTAAISAYQVALSAASVTSADPTSVGSLAAALANSIYSIETVVQEAQAKSGRKSDTLNTAVTVAGVTLTVGLQVAMEIAVINNSGATTDQLESILNTIEADDAIIQAS